MISIRKEPVAEEKLDILSADSKYDLACACATGDDGHRRRSPGGRWIYPVALPQGGTTYLFKTLLSNECVNGCSYCPLNKAGNARRCRLEPEELVKVFLNYYRKRRVSGLFLSSGVIGSPDAAMQRINCAGRLLRKMNFRGYIHLKIIPGASEAAIREALSLSTAVSLNIETAGEKHFQMLSRTKNYNQDIIKGIKLISRLTQKGAPFEHVKQTTQFVVGASKETDKEIVNYSWGLYKRLGLNRVYFSAYQKNTLEPGAKAFKENNNMLTREHRLYQADWLLRKYGFRSEEIPFEKDGNLSLVVDPKEAWAKSHPESFPVNINKASKFKLLRVPGFGEATVNRIIKMRRSGHKLQRIEELGIINKLLKKAFAYIAF